MSPAKDENSSENSLENAADRQLTAPSGENETSTGAPIGTRLTQPRSRSVRHPGHVYFILAGDKVKIGYSARPLDRLRELQTSHPDKLAILATIPGSLKTERRLHERFERYKVRREWFRFTPEIRQFIDRFGHNRKKQSASPIPVVPSKPKPPTLPEVSRLLKLRSQHGASTPIGHRCSNLAEMLPLFERTTDPAQKSCLAANIQRQIADLARLRAGAQ